MIPTPGRCSTTKKIELVICVIMYLLMKNSLALKMYTYSNAGARYGTVDLCYGGLAVYRRPSYRVESSLVSNPAVAAM